MTKETLRNYLMAGCVLQATALIILYGVAGPHPTALHHLVAVEGGFLIATWIFMYRFICNRLFAPPKPVQLRLGLIDSGGVLKGELDLTGRQSAVIGKTTADTQADIDLSESEHPEFVEEQHAVLNCIGTQWYLEAVSDLFSVGLKKSGEAVTVKLKPDIPYPIAPGDLIYISYERIAVRG